MAKDRTSPPTEADDLQVEPPADRAIGQVSGGDIIRSKLRTLPGKPGVYRMLDDKGNALYVGKAKNLKKRVASYTNPNGLSNRIARMVAATRDLVVITTHTEVEALLLEANFIKRYKPPFNVLLRDDKSFPHILISRNHDWPRLTKHRGARRVTGDYFGPYATVGAVNHSLNTLQRAFLLRSCTDSMFENRSRPCLLYQIKRCSAPCVGLISEEDYRQTVDDAAAFLAGKSQEIQQRFADQMQQASNQQDYERATIYRDRIRALTQIQTHQGISARTFNEADIFALHQDAGQSCIQVFFFRAGQNRGNRAFFPRHDKSHEAGEILAAFLAQFYDGKQAPRSILVNLDINEHELLEQALSTRSDRKVTITKPLRGEKKNLVAHAETNAREAIARRLAESSSQRRLLEQVADIFKLDKPPQRIEIYDNSHISGSHSIGAMVVAGQDGFIKNAYRKFNIRDSKLAPGDDYGMMREVLTRRFARLMKENKEETQADSEENAEGSSWPDLVLIDGGAGQLSAVQEVFTELGVTGVHLAAIAKGPDRNAGLERFFTLDEDGNKLPPFSLERKSPVLYYLQRLRDEAHRFAIGTHRARRKKAIVRSLLDDVPGIGPQRKKALLHHFGSARAVAQAGLTDLERVEGVSKGVARNLYDHFHGDEAC